MNKKNKILVVDDDTDTLILLRGFLQHDGYQVVTSETAEEALEMLERWEVDLVITDLRMPGMSGIDFMHELRGWDAELPIILITGMGNGNGRQTAEIKSEATAFLAKPFRKDALLKTVRKALKEKDALASS